jgi:endonuclease/exonuclease/phosphatase family metal-dependent hydrolase
MQHNPYDGPFMTRILTYNVHSCRGVDGKLDVGRVADVIAQSRPDIIALQEVDVGRRRTHGVDQAHAIAERLGMAFHFNAAVHVEEERYGDAILTALPLKLIKSGPLPTPPRMQRLEPRGALWVEIEVESGHKVQIINTHLGLVPMEQKTQAAHLLGGEWLGHPKCSDPLILLGDFNATPRYAAYKALSGRLRDARRAAGVRGGALTFPSRFPMIRIDHMFISPSIEVANMHAPDGALMKIASDHLPLVADFRVRG